MAQTTLLLETSALGNVGFKRVLWRKEGTSKTYNAAHFIKVAWSEWMCLTVNSL